MKNGATRDVPVWAIAAALTVTLLVVVYFGIGAFTGHAADPGAPMKVYPGMYNLRAEALNARPANPNRLSSATGTADGR